MPVSDRISVQLTGMEVNFAILQISH